MLGSSTNWSVVLCFVDYNEQCQRIFLTGVQLEVGDKATPFEHKSKDELRSQIAWKLAIFTRHLQNG